MAHLRRRYLNVLALALAGVLEGGLTFSAQAQVPPSAFELAAYGGHDAAARVDVPALQRLLAAGAHAFAACPAEGLYLDGALARASRGALKQGAAGAGSA